MHRKIFNYVGPYFNIMNDKVKHTCKTLSQSSSAILANDRSLKMPALLTTISTFPKDLIAASTIFSPSSTES